MEEGRKRESNSGMYGSHGKERELGGGGSGRKEEWTRERKVR